ncbi:MAG: 3'-5' exonuclease [Salinivirgaceae bacterium]|nr:MAG: 3'-5' exonuclease [Salinivirgaceae bacterium]
MQNDNIYEILIQNILFLDIETVPEIPSYHELDDATKYLWDKKAERIRNSEDEDQQELYHKAGIFAEFGKIVCISCGIVTPEYKIRIKSFASDNEKELLENFKALLNSSYTDKDKLLCAHNGKEFDFPYIARRMLVNGIMLPEILQIAGKKPWEIRHLDTLELWKFGDYKNYTSLALLTKIFNIPTPKDDISGADVHKVYWEEKNLNRIVEYCQKDVVAIIQLFLKYRVEPLVDQSNITFA